MNQLSLCSLYPAACLRDHSPPLPLFHPERKNLQQVYQFKCCPHTLPQHQKTMSCCIKPNMSFFSGLPSNMGKFSNHPGTVLHRYFLTYAFTSSDIWTMRFFLRQTVEEGKKCSGQFKSESFFTHTLNIVQSFCIIRSKLYGLYLRLRHLACSRVH